ncbi:MAG: 3-hydroxybutyryl-CoA dehydrogenase [Proteobacteria bacterium]|nr:3-hydroxybutyryl-CoA dehydrogenase [Pseudomonadota bacterium]
MKTIAVIGSGTMGAGIAQAAAQAGANVIMRDVEQRFIDRGRKTIEDSLARFAKKGIITADQQAQMMALIVSCTDLGAVKEADIVIEAVTENMAVKKQLFAELDAICPEKTVFATNTSSLSVAEMAQSTRRPDRFIGMHFFNPVPMMKLVEVVRTIHTSEKTVQLGVELATCMGKEPIVTKDKPGFIFNRLIIPYLNEAMWAVYEGVGSALDVDRAMKLGGNMPIGPLALLDLIGIDVQEHACHTLFEEFGDPKFRVCPLNRAMVRAGLLGKKTGKGFYDYSTDPPGVVDLSAL